MTVYVDLLFALNTAINYLLLRGSGALGGCGAAAWRLWAAAAAGGVYAIASVAPGLAWLQGWLCQLFCAAAMLLIAFGVKKNTVKQGLFFFALSFAFGGAVLLTVQLVEPDCVILGSRAYYAVSMPAMLLMAGVCFGISAVVLKGCGTHTGGDIIPVTLLLERRSLELKALRDTGNTLTDPVTGQAVLIVEGERLLSLFPMADAAARLQDPPSLMQELSEKYPDCRFRLISYRAVGVECGLLLAVRCRGKIGKQVQPLLAAFSPGELSGDHTFQALWGGAVI